MNTNLLGWSPQPLVIVLLVAAAQCTAPLTLALSPLRHTAGGQGTQSQKPSRETSTREASPAASPNHLFPLTSAPLTSEPLNTEHSPLRKTAAPAAAEAQREEIPRAVWDAEQQRIAVIARAVPSALSVFGASGGGSGVVITPDGYALTNFHVVKPLGDYLQCGMPDGRLYDAVVVGLDPTGDTAMIKLLGRDDFPHAELGDSDQVRAGDWCFAVGNPFLLATDFQPTVTYGIVSGVRRYQYPAGTLLEYTDCIQTDAAINPGNSGGPLFSDGGRLIGVVGRASFEKRGRVNVGVGYAISINQIKNFMSSLRSGRIVDHATLGATVSSDDAGRVVVSNILESSDAWRRGLRYGDEIVALAGHSIGAVNAFKNVLGVYPKGWRVPLRFRRDGQQREILVRLAGVHSTEELLAKIERPEGPPLEPGPKPRGGGKGQPQPPKPAPPQPRVREPPATAARYIEHRRGYANYYFNRLNQDRVWKAFEAAGGLRGLSGRWLLRGQLAAGGDVELLLDDQSATARLPTGVAKIDATKDLADQLAPAGSGGLLAALHLWRRLLALGPQQYGEVYYLGAAPALEHDRLLDVLVGTHNVVESRFLFDPGSGQLAAIEMQPDINADPCEIYFDDYREAAGRRLPHRLTVRCGDHVFAEIQVKQFLLPDKES